MKKRRIRLAAALLLLSACAACTACTACSRPEAGNEARQGEPAIEDAQEAASTAGLPVTGTPAESTPAEAADAAEPPPAAFWQVQAEPTKYEAEDGVLSGGTQIESSKKGFTGTGYVTGFEEDADRWSIEISIAEEGFYDLQFVAFAIGGRKENILYVDGENIGSLATEKEHYTQTVFPRIFLTQGGHTLELRKSYGWIGLDSVTVCASEALDPAIYEADRTLVNPNADENTRRLMHFLADNYGKNILSGQYSQLGFLGLELQSIYRTTGKRPAVLGLDFIEYSPSRQENGSTSSATEHGIAYYKEHNGIVTFCWHWNPPSKYLTGIWWRGFYTDSTDIDLAKIMNGQDPEGYGLLLQDIDAIAEQLKILEENQVPVLWRPLHEASGGWFWWGAKGSDAYKKLWILLYDRLTNVHGLDNLIWLWNGQDSAWYPGDAYVDIIGEDIYPGERVYASQMAKYLEACRYTDAQKMIVLSENGCLFDPDLAIRDGAMWGFFAVWSGEFVLKNDTLNAYSERYTEEEMLKKVYHHPRVITLDELPDLKTYETGVRR